MRLYFPSDLLAISCKGGPGQDARKVASFVDNKKNHFQPFSVYIARLPTDRMPSDPNLLPPSQKTTIASASAFERPMR